MCQAQELHQQILAARAHERSAVRDLALLLSQLDRSTLTELRFASIFNYAHQVLDLTIRQTRVYLRIGRCLPSFPVLDEALRDGKIGPSHARELLRVITTDTEAEWVDRAASRTSREIERLVSVSVTGEPPPNPEPEPGPARQRLVFELEATEASEEATSPRDKRAQPPEPGRGSATGRPPAR